MRENKIQAEIREQVSARCPGIVLRLNSGMAYGGDRVIDTPEYGRVLLNPRRVALCPPGTSDLVYFGPGGQTVFLEVKNERGKAREAQERFLALMNKYGFNATLVRSADDAVAVINGGTRHEL